MPTFELSLGPSKPPVQWVKVKVAPYHATGGTGGNRHITLPMLNLGARGGWVVKATTRLLYPGGRDPGINCTEDWVSPRVDLDGFWRRENLFPAPGSEHRTVEPVASPYSGLSDGYQRLYPRE
jgi:hypothetical protein